MSTARKTGEPKPLATTAAKPAKNVMKKPVEKVEEKQKGKKKSGSKTTGKSSKAVKPAIFVQYLGQEINYEEVVGKVKAAWSLQGNKISQINTLDIYVKPEELSIYYVINSEITGKISM